VTSGLALAGAPRAVPASAPKRSQARLLDPDLFRHYVDAFNLRDEETTASFIDNRSAWPWLKANVPFFECPDKEFEEIYYFRWWTYRKHITKTPVGFVVTEFLAPVPWAGKYNSINCAAGHHIYEGRWIQDSAYLNDYAAFWFLSGGGNPRLYSFWVADSIYALFLVKQDRRLLEKLLPSLVKNYAAWEENHAGPDGLFWQIDDRDGMEDSIGGSGYRPTINSYMFGDASAISTIAGKLGEGNLAQQFSTKAAAIKKLVQTKLWNKGAQFFETLPRDRQDLVDVREEIGFVPWYFNLPDNGYEGAWGQLMDSRGFPAPFGITTTERRSPRFMFKVHHECLWNGPVWPYATTQTLAAFANLLNHYEQQYVRKADYFHHLALYAKSQHRRLPDGSIVPWIDEDLDPFTGTWLARKILHEWRRPDKDRGKDYNHSAFCDLVITGLVGLRPRADDVVEVNPLLPTGTWPYFCLDNVSYHGRTISIAYDEDGRRYGKGAGLRVFIDGEPAASSDRLTRLTASLNAKSR